MKKYLCNVDAGPFDTNAGDVRAIVIQKPRSLNLNGAFFYAPKEFYAIKNPQIRLRGDWKKVNIIVF
ncbi:hypothetical protein GCM10008018_06820 [Paenibacillus marchantiophytorum]|uniref:Uncharacterized protein n=1 Tax=Paenibacillus marchantiophytorum TaxID=1619310 RepID=A0ABQ2BRJ9_9BACL|nr:hypothetical protein [Paenibacillus marchantiophytorum]GGI44381.1 hypothetical protein GCM10008018_06820 [Paenibacillus marchantiophytorum]